MKRIAIISILLLAQTMLLRAEVPTFYDVVSQNKIKFNAISKGGFQGETVELHIQNLLSQPLKFKIEAGTQFDSKEDWTQNLMVVKEMIVSLSPKEKSSFLLHTVCIQAGNASPFASETFTLLPKAEGELLALAQIASEKKYYASSTLQSAIWTITDQAPISTVYGTDAEMLAVLIPSICTYRKVSPSDFNLTPRPHRIVSLSTSLECLLPDYVVGAALRAYDRNGRLTKTFWEGKTLVPGFYQFKLGIYHHESDTTTFFVRLEKENQIIAEKIATSRDVIVPVRRLTKETIVTYEIPQDIVARVAVYDSADNLYALIADNQPLTQGFNKAILYGTRELPLGISYYLKITDLQNGNTIVRKKILLNDEEAKKYPLRTKRGKLEVTLKSPVSGAKLAIYDQENRVVWVVFENSQLGHGFKTYDYVFQHEAGENAYFVARLTDQAGNIIAEKCIQGCSAR